MRIIKSDWLETIYFNTTNYRKHWSHILPICLSIYGSTALVGLGRFFSFLILHTVGRTFWTGVRPSEGRYLHTGPQEHRINEHRHPCLECDSNPWSQCSSGWRRFMPQTARPLWSALHIYATVIIFLAGFQCELYKNNFAWTQATLHGNLIYTKNILQINKKL
jgi:hypothetical protein